MFECNTPGRQTSLAAFPPSSPPPLPPPPRCLTQTGSSSHSSPLEGQNTPLQPVGLSTTNDNTLTTFLILFKQQYLKYNYSKKWPNLYQSHFCLCVGIVMFRGSGVGGYSLEAWSTQGLHHSFLLPPFFSLSVWPEEKGRSCCYAKETFNCVSFNAPHDWLSPCSCCSLGGSWWVSVLSWTRVSILSLPLLNLFWRLLIRSILTAPKGGCVWYMKSVFSICVWTVCTVCVYVLTVSSAGP